MKYITLILCLICSLSNTTIAQETDELYAKASSLAKARNFNESLPLFNKLIDLDSSDHKYYLERGRVFVELDDWDKAMSDLILALTPVILNNLIHTQN
jgi:tetratricopeptide (TPR) repeat protein